MNKTPREDVLEMGRHHTGRRWWNIIEELSRRPSACGYSCSPHDMAALNNLLAEECARLRSAADATLTRAKQVLRVLRLQVLFHEVKMFVESDNGAMIAGLFSQTETFLERYRPGEGVTPPPVAATIASLQKQLRVKSHRWHQLPCTPITTARRAELIRKYLTPTSRILCLGDDDFVSVVLALTVPNEITVLDIDPQIIALIEQVSSEQHLRITCQRADIRKPLPAHLYDSFEAVVTDPIYSVREMLRFLSVAEACLRKTETSYLLSCCSRPMAGAAWHEIEAWAASRGLVIHEFLSGFNEYRKRTRIRTMLNLAERLFLRSPVARACVRIPFVYSDLVVFRFQPTQRGNEL